jgi:hypothetical protein
LGLQVAVNDAVVVHVLQGLANQAGDLERVLFRQRPHRLEQVRERAALQILRDDVRPALVLDRDELEDERVV